MASTDGNPREGDMPHTEDRQSRQCCTVLSSGPPTASDRTEMGKKPNAVKKKNRALMKQSCFVLPFFKLIF